MQDVHAQPAVAHAYSLSNTATASAFNVQQVTRSGYRGRTPHGNTQSEPKQEYRGFPLPAVATTRSNKGVPAHNHRHPTTTLNLITLCRTLRPCVSVYFWSLVT